jgi:hypothetical protein
MEVTLDTNEVITLAKDALGTYMSEAERLDAEHLKLLRDFYHKRGLITLSVGRITFLEAEPKDATEPPNVIAQKRIVDAGLNIDRVQLERGWQFIPVYCRNCNGIVFGHDLDYAQLIRSILTGNKKIDAHYHQYRQRRMNDPEEKVERIWHNHFNDIWGLFEHVSWGGDIFVTSDPDFLKKRDKLALVVPGKILRPKETVELLSKMALPLTKAPAWQPRVAIQQCRICRLKQQLAG